MNLNLTSTMTSEQIFLEAYKSVAVPVLVYAWIATVLLFAIIGVLMIDGRQGKNPYRKFSWIWAVSTFVSGTVLYLIATSPLFIQNLNNWILNTFG